MSLSRTPPNEASASASSSAGDNICNVCSTNMSDNDDCLVIDKCSHSFHRPCIENYLSNTAQCPNCSRPCDLVDLKRINFSNKSDTQGKQSIRGRGRGAVTMPYNTRSQSRTQYHDSQRSLGDTRNELDEEDGSVAAQPPLSIRDSSSQNIPPISQDEQNTRINLDYNQLNQMIETTMARLFSNFNRVPNHQPQANFNGRGNTNHSSNRANVNETNPRSRLTNNAGEHTNNYTHNYSDRSYSSVPTNTNASSFNPDKLTAIIQSWNIKFDGSTSSLSVEEFLYRIYSLTNDNFNGDFTPIVKNLNVLLNGKAKDWYWRYRKQVNHVNWEDFCEALKCQYRDFKSIYDIKEEIRNRKQKVGESFDTFFDGISSIMDRLPLPIAEMELIEILTRNLRPEIRQDILYVPVHSIPHLRKLVQMRETFWNEDHVRKNLTNRAPAYAVPRRHLAEVDFEESKDLIASSSDEINAIAAIERIIHCWNCGDRDHVWVDCLKPRTIFCYGCGAKETYKPQCPKCSIKKNNLSKNSLLHLKN
ncbi:putative E3 ubiquitin-protein ligase ATL44 [Lucilia cuprina]|nr:putative E3 ubiquitin-protein ligase ATL44 [Lucilia cuprina]